MSLFRNLLIEKKRRKYYCEVEYLQSSGTQYIDTGVIFSNSYHTYKWDIGAQAVNTGNTNYNWFCGLFEGGANSAGTYADTTTNYRFYAVGTYYQNGQVITSPLTNGDKYGIIRNVFTITNFAGTLPIILFGRNQSNGVKCEATKKIFYYKIYDNDILVRDMIPVLGWDGKGYMYDKVSGRLFGNAGTGDFVAGRQVHYVDYLENIIGQANLNYIPTTYTPTTNTNVEAKVRYTGGASGATWAIGAATWWGIHYQGQGPKIGITNSSTDKYQVYTPYTAGNDITLKLDGSNVYADGTLVGSLTKQNASSTLTIFRYSNSANLSWVGRIYYLDIWDNNGDVYKFRPAIDENGVSYLFDRVSHTCFLNQGTGSFKYPAREVEYLESSGTQYIDTGVKGKNNLAYKTKIKYTSLSTSGSNGIGGEYKENASAYIGMVRANGHFTYLYYNTAIETTKTLYANTDYVVDSVQNSGSQIVKIDDEVISNGTLTGTFTSTRNIFLFAVCSTNNAADVFGSLKMSYCQILDNGTMVRDFIPCYKDGQAGFLNKVDGTFFTNSGTGQFLTGKIVEPEYE